ncbi:hypothetical protein BX600DRAFT_457634 [Xylariales sp. PMI_506]|nr:hypothetical protein BX600DRAFT_457634 [Xylariales sp. PMI_506]
MSVRISLDNPPEFFTNLDFIQGRVILGLNRPETVGNIIVKLEGDCKTAMSLNDEDQSNVVAETHKLLYLVEQVYPDPRAAASMAVGAMPGVLPPGQHEFRFRFKIPLNNICGNPKAMAALNGVGGFGPGSSGGLFGGFRTMDGSRQLMLQHVKATLPPSLTGLPRKAEIRYYVKVTIQRPGLFKENWRYSIGFKFLPIEPPRPPATSQEAYARRPFTFKPRTPGPQKKSFFGNKPSQADNGPAAPPAIEISARLPFPSILTCNQPIPLRLIAKKLAPSQEQVYLVSVEIALVGFTSFRVYDIQQTEVTRWMVCSATNLSIPVGDPKDEVDVETVLPDSLWARQPLPNTIAPSFTACNLSRRYELQVRLCLSWGLPNKSGKASAPYPQIICLPLKLSKVDVFSGIHPPTQLVKAASTRPHQQQQQQQPQQQGPPLPPRRTSTSASTSAANAAPASSAPPQVHDPLYPPQLGPDNTPAYDDAPPSYDEAMAQELTGPVERPAYSGITAENAPSTMPPEKSGLH